MKKLTILVDMDDVLECLLEAWLDYNNKRFNRNVQPEDIHQWDMSGAYPGIPFDDVYHAELDPELWKTVGPKAGADEGLRKLIADGHEVFVVTASFYETLKEKLDDVLFRYFPYLDREHIIITFRKYMVKGDVLVDDGPHNFPGGEYKGILFTAPHNRDLDAEKLGLIRADNWDEVYEIISRMAEE